MSQLSLDQIADFHSKGFLLVPQVLTKEEVKWLRSFLRRRISPLPTGDLDRNLYDLYNRNPDVRWLLFHQRSMEVLRSLLGPSFTITTETDAHLNCFGNWHRDTDIPESEGHQYFRDPEFLMVNAAYYLQENTPSYGGGLEVVPGSHRTDSRESIGSVNVPTQPGDLLIFNIRLYHRASQPRLPITEERHEKIAIFHTCGRSNEFTDAHNDFVCRRPDLPYLREFRYDSDMISRARSANVQLSMPLGA